MPLFRNNGASVDLPGEISVADSAHFEPSHIAFMSPRFRVDQGDPAKVELATFFQHNIRGAFYVHTESFERLGKENLMVILFEPHDREKCRPFLMARGWTADEGDFDRHIETFYDNIAQGKDYQSPMLRHFQEIMRQNMGRGPLGRKDIQDLMLLSSVIPIPSP